MSTDPPDLPLPPLRTNPEGDPRRIGIELEMSGLTLDQLAGLVAGFLAVEIHSDGRYQRVLHGDSAGDWVVELDFHLLKELGREKYDPALFADDLRNSAEGVLRWIAESFVPLELVSPPLPMERLPQVDTLIALLRDAGAKGTSDRPINAFSMQFNPEIPNAEPATLSAYLKAFLCLYEWLYLRADINITRRLTSYVDPFPVEYVRLVVDPAYQPSIDTLIDDYLLHNPTRNRALDLLPLFLHLDEPRVRRITSDPLIKGRPAFHYRLPDCEIHRPGWGLHLAWNDWLQVELLAADPQRLADCCTAYHAFMHRPPLERWLGDWTQETIARWLVR